MTPSIAWWRGEGPASAARVSASAACGVRQAPSLVALVASQGSSCSADTRCLGDLSGVLLGVLTDPPGEKLNGHDAERRMSTLARPVGVGQCLQQPCELLVLSHDCVQQTADRLTAGQAGATITLLVAVGEDRSLLVEEAADPEPVDVDDDIAQVGQCLQRRPLSLPRRLTEPVWRRGLHDAPHDAGRRPHPLEDHAMLRVHSPPLPTSSSRLLLCLDMMTSARRS